MFESTQSLLPLDPDGKPLKAITLGFEEESMDELHRLLDTLGVRVTSRDCSPLRKVHPATYVGKGRVEAVKGGEGVLVVDEDLSPNQLRNIEKIVEMPVVDRTGVILEIFSRHARTREAKVQVELAKLNYLLPRLAHYWSHFERQRGAKLQRGMGEKQIEVDRRLLQNRVSLLHDRLKTIEKQRGVRRSGRKDILKVALVGYTNAGKSTLLNGLTHSEVLAEDQLFATLDASVRSLDPHSHPPVVAIDTVGFIKNIPTQLIASFKSTLEEIREADLILVVLDASSPSVKEHYEVTLGTLEELDLLDQPRMVALNKIDLIENEAALHFVKVAIPGAYLVSATDLESVVSLRGKILDHFRDRLTLLELMIPYGESKVEAQIHAHGQVLGTRHMDKGTYYRVKIDETWAGRLNLKRFML